LYYNFSVIELHSIRSTCCVWIISKVNWKSWQSLMILCFNSEANVVWLKITEQSEIDLFLNRFLYFNICSFPTWKIFYHEYKYLSNIFIIYKYIYTVKHVYNMYSEIHDFYYYYVLLYEKIWMWLKTEIYLLLWNDNKLVI